MKHLTSYREWHGGVCLWGEGGGGHTPLEGKEAKLIVMTYSLVGSACIRYLVWRKVSMNTLY